MRDIVQSFLLSRVPVVVWVAPQGARAASAGAIITISAHVAAMAPGTAIGAATPVDLQGGDISTKIINDAAAYAESLAKLRGRNVEFAVSAVRKGTSIAADEAVRIGAVDLIAATRPALLRAIDGREVKLSGGAGVTLRTSGAEVDRYELRGFRSVLQWLADPNLAFLFLSIGTLAIIYELANPGIGAGGIVGVILIVTAMFSLSVLPVNAVGAILMLLSLGLFVAEVLTPGVGVFAAGGTASLLLGGVFLFRGSVGVDLGVSIPIALVVGACAVVFTRLAWRSRHLPSQAGAPGLVGARGVVRAADGLTGDVFVNGAWWRARSASGPLVVGSEVRVLELDGLTLIVDKTATGREGEKL